MSSTWNVVPFTEAVDICDTLRKPINSSERASRIKGKEQSELYPYYGATGQVGFIDDYITDGEYVLLGEDGAPFLDAFSKKAYIISGKTWVNNHAHVLKSKTNNKFLCYYLNSFNYKGYVSGTTRLKLTQAEMKRIPVPVPPLSEQERIVARIEELFSQLDAGVETLKKTKAQLAVYRQTVLKEAFEGKYTPDVTMHEIKMGEIADGKDGLRRGPFGSAIKKAFFVESGYKVYEQGNAINNDCKRGHYYISADKYNELSSFQLRPGDFIVSCSGTIGKIAQLPADAELGVINQALMRIRLKPDVIDPYYFMMQFRSEVFQRKIVSRGSGMGNLAGIKEFKLATMFIPENYENQKQIVAEIELRMSVCDSIEQTVDTALQQAEAMRQSILKDAFEGRL